MVIDHIVEAVDQNVGIQMIGDLDLGGVRPSVVLFDIVQDIAVHLTGIEFVIFFKFNSE